MSGSLMDELSRHAVEMWPKWFPERPVPELHGVITAAGKAHRDRAFVFLLRRRGKAEIVFKIAFSEEEAGYVTREFENLSQLFPILPVSLRDHIPAPLGIHRLGSGVAVALGVLEGHRLLVPDVTRLGTPAARVLLRRFFRNAFRWSRSLAMATQNADLREAGSLGDLLDRFVAAFPMDERQLRRFQGFGKALDAGGFQWRPAWQHGDLAVGNVLVHRGSLRLLDWEHARGDAEPWFDVSYAPICSSALGARQAGLASMLDGAPLVLDEERWSGRIMREEMEAVWDYPLPLPWAVAITGIRTTVRRMDQGRRGWLPWGRLTVALLTDDEFRHRVPWLAPHW